MSLSITWNQAWQKQWRQWLLQAPSCPLEQSWCYGEAIARYFNTKVERGVIYQDKEPVALVQIIRKTGVSQLMRGPVFLKDLTADEQQQVYQQIRNRYGWRRDGFLFWSPELIDAPHHKAMLRQLRLWKLQKGYKTSWLDLTKDIAVLRKNLKGNWRNQLSKAERSGLVVKHAKKDVQIAWLLQQYAEFRKSRKMAAPSGRLMEATYKYFSLQQDALPLIAYHNNKAIAGILLLKHGQCATYHMGVTTEIGRQKNAHNLLLWQGLTILKEQQVKSLDLGGLDDKHMTGISRFKRGVGGTEIQLAGLWF